MAQPHHNHGMKARANLKRATLKRAAVAVLLAAGSVFAGPPVRTDGSVGAVRSFGGPNINIPASLGRRGGGNLVHSFDRFYPNGTQGTLSRPHTVNFLAPTDVTNVIARVTGGRSTNLAHTSISIREVPDGPPIDANFYLLNPAGVLIGRNVRFDVRGAVFITTADALKFADGVTLPSTAGAVPVLTSSEPIGATFNNMSPKAISVVGGRIQLRAAAAPDPVFKQVVSLVGGGIRVQDGAVQVSSGRVNFVSVAGPGEVTLSGVDPEQLPALSDGMARGDVELRHTDASPGSETAVGTFRQPLLNGGLSRFGLSATVAIVGENLKMSGGDPRDPVSDPSQPRVATGPGTQTLIVATTRGRPADMGVSIDLTGDLLATGQAKIFSESQIGEQSQPMRIRARDISFSLLPDDQPYEADGAFFLAGIGINNLFRDGNNSIGARLEIDCRHLTLLNGATIGGRPNAASGGAVTISATGDVLFRNGVVRELTGRGFRTGITTEVNQRDTNTPGAPIALNVGGDLSLLDGGAINSAVRLGQADANGGNITVRVPNGTLRAESRVGTAGFLSGIDTALVPDNNAPGNGGNIDIEARHLFIGNRAAVSSRTQATGGGGIITIKAESITLDGAGLEVDGSEQARLSRQTEVFTGILTSSQKVKREVASGNAGDITLNVTGKLTLRNNAAIAAESSGEGAGGDIIINAGRVQLSGGPEILIDGQPLAGQGTRISALSTSTFTSGTAGTVLITADRLTLDRSRIATSAELSDGGNIDLILARELGLVHSSITTAAGTKLIPGGELEVDGGNILGRAQSIGLNDSQVQADALDQGGAISLISRGTIRDRGSIVSSFSTTDPRFNGTIEITRPDEDFAGELARLITALLPPEARLQPCCELKLTRDLSSFTLKPQSAPPLDPAGWVPVMPAGK